MKRTFSRASSSFGVRHSAFYLVAGTLLAAGSVAAEDFVTLFNGKDLDGWVNINGAPETWSVTNGMIHCSGHPTGAMRTVKQYENFILEGEWRHLSSGGNSGFFIWGGPIPAPAVPYLRGIEVQVLDHGYNVKGKNEWYTTHGDVFPIHGATMKPIGKGNGMRCFPSEERSKPSPEWNHYRIVGSNGTIRLSVNGKEVSGGNDCNYRKGYIALESEGAPVEFRNLRIMELPSSGAPAELTAPLDQGWRCLFNGLDLRGWNEATGWKAAGERLAADATGGSITTASDFGDAEFVFDVKAGKDAPVVLFRCAALKIDGLPAGNYQRCLVRVKEGVATLSRNGAEQLQLNLPKDAPARGSFGLRGAGAAFFNLFVRDL